MFSMFFKSKKSKQRNKTERLRVRPSVENLEARLTPTNWGVGPTLGNNVEYTSVQALFAAHVVQSNDQVSVFPGATFGNVQVYGGLNHVQIQFQQQGVWVGQLTLSPTDTMFQIQGGNPQQDVLEAPASPAGNTPLGTAAIIELNGATNVQIQNFAIMGNANTQFGIRVDGGATGAQIQNMLITNILETDGAAVMVGRTYPGDNTTGTAQVQNNTISGYGSTGITVDSVGSYAQIQNNLVEGLGPKYDQANYGIQISRGGLAMVQNNNVTGNYNTDPNFVESAGILVVYDMQTNPFKGPDYDEDDLTGPVIQNNNCYGNEDGIFLQESNAIFAQNNKCYANIDDGITVVDSNYCFVENNQTTQQNVGNGRNGIGVYGGDPYTDNGTYLPTPLNVPTGGHDYFMNNQIQYSGGDGFFLDYQFTSSSGVPAQDALINNQSQNNGGAGYDFLATGSTLVWNNQAKNNTGDGYTFQAAPNYNNVSVGSNNNLLVQDQAQQNLGNGMSFYSSGNNEIFQSNVQQSGQNGMLFSSSNGNSLIQDQTQQSSQNGMAFVSSSSNTIINDQSQNALLDGFTFTVGSDGNLIEISQAQNNPDYGFYQDATSTGDTYIDDQAQTQNGSVGFSSNITNINQQPQPQNPQLNPYLSAWANANGFNTVQWGPQTFGLFPH